MKILLMILWNNNNINNVWNNININVCVIMVM